MSVQDLSGVLFFPVAPFTAVGTVEAESLAEHLRRGLAAGGPLPVARQFARAAQEAGVDGLLLMPPYLVAAPPAGLVAYTSAVARPRR
jgi:5-dehydro-4-deoxyglucarate dehydratase